MEKKKEEVMKFSPVNPKKCPRLARAIAQIQARGRGEWERVVELRREGNLDAADRLARKLLGVQGPPMSEEVKEKLRAYNEAHRDEIKARRKQEREVRQRTVALLTTGRRRR